MRAKPKVGSFYRLEYPKTARMEKQAHLRHGARVLVLIASTSRKKGLRSCMVQFECGAISIVSYNHLQELDELESKQIPLFPSILDWNKS